MAEKCDAEKVCFIVWYRVRNALPQRRKENRFHHGGQEKQHSAD